MSKLRSFWIKDICGPRSPGWYPEISRPGDLGGLKNTPDFSEFLRWCSIKYRYSSMAMENFLLKYLKMCFFELETSTAGCPSKPCLITGGITSLFCSGTIFDPKIPKDSLSARWTIISCPAGQQVWIFVQPYGVWNQVIRISVWQRMDFNAFRFAFGPIRRSTCYPALQQRYPRQEVVILLNNRKKLGVSLT